jgi:hypothetical protein
MTMLRTVLRIGGAIAIAAALGMLASCATPGREAGRWITFDAATQRFAIDAQGVPRGALLDELKAIEGTEVRPQADRDAAVTAKAQNLDLDGLLALLLPAGTHVTVRPGTRELAAATTGGEKRKRGAELKPNPGAEAKPEASAALRATTPRGTNLKPAADAAYVPREVAGARAKPPSATLLRVAGADQTRPAPKQPAASRAERATVRLQLEFSDGGPPRIVDARAIEGRAPAQRIVAGTYLYALVAADGRILEAGTFQDPLIEHSYLPDGTHSEGRARTGVVGVSILRENLAAATLRVVDVGAVAMPHELDDRAVRAALDQGKLVLQADAAAILRLVDQGGK